MGPVLVVSLTILAGCGKKDADKPIIDNTPPGKPTDNNVAPDNNTPGKPTNNNLPPTKNDSKEKKIYTREEFKALVTGKTPEEVIQAIGKPDTTTETSTLTSWHYRKITKDPGTDKIDTNAHITFKNGLVSHVSFG